MAQAVTRIALVLALACCVATLSSAQTSGPAPTTAPATLASGVPSTAPASPQQREAFMRGAVEATIKSFETEMADPNARPELRRYSLYAHYVLALGQDPSKAEAALKKLLARQRINPNDKLYGEFPAEGSGGAEAAGTEFVVLPMAQIMIRYSDKLSPELRDQMTQSLKLALVGVRSRKISVDFTNVFLLNAVDELLLGEVVRDEKAIAGAQAKLTAFLTAARARGLQEYSAPHQSAVQLSVLLIAHHYTLQPEAHRLLEPLVKFMWAKIVADAVPGRGTLGGPHSRDVDFIFGYGAADSYLYLQGLRPLAPIVPEFSEGLVAYTSHIEGAMRPGKSILDLSATPRIVRSRWGAQRGMDRYFYVTDDYAIGSASMTASSHDKKLTAEFTTPRELPAIAIVTDPLDQPYGRMRAPTGQPMMPAHLGEQIAAVQEKNTLLALMNSSAEVKGRGLFNLSTNALFPIAADSVLLDGKRIAFDKPFELVVPSDATLIVREGNGAVAIRFFGIDGALKQTPQIVLKFDGNPWGVGRFAAYHYRSDAPQRATDAFIRAGVVMIAGRASNDVELMAFVERSEAMKVEHSIEHEVWRATLTDGELKLEAALGLSDGSIIARRVNGDEFASPVFRVNDRDMAAELLGF